MRSGGHLFQRCFHAATSFTRDRQVQHISIAFNNLRRSERTGGTCVDIGLIRWKTTTANTTTHNILPSTSTVATKDDLLHNPHFRIARIRYGQENIDYMNMSTTQLLRETSIFARDLLTLNATARQDLVEPKYILRAPAAIVPRGNLILVSFGNIRAVVGLNEVHLLDAHRPAVQDFANGMLQVFQQRHLYSDHRNVPAEGQNPHEIVFLEGLLRDTVEAFSRRVRIYEPIVEDYLVKVTEEVYSNTGVHQLAPLKDSLQSFEMHVQQCVDCLSSLLDDDEAMLDLLLTEQKEAEAAGREIDFARHEQVELLLGVYARHLSMTLMEIQFMLRRLQSKQEFLALALDSKYKPSIRMHFSERPASHI